MTTRLAALVRRQLVRPDRAQLAGEDGFRFRHLLIRDAAYDALPKASAPTCTRASPTGSTSTATRSSSSTRSSATTSSRPPATWRELGRPDPALAERAAAAARRRRQACERPPGRPGCARASVAGRRAPAPAPARPCARARGGVEHDRSRWTRGRRSGGSGRRARRSRGRPLGRHARSRHGALPAGRRGDLGRREEPEQSAGGAPRRGGACRSQAARSPLDHRGSCSAIGGCGTTRALRPSSERFATLASPETPRRPSHWSSTGR